jgi:glycosyltransferase involved in cell wall biosynthesis
LKAAGIEVHCLGARHPLGFPAVVWKLRRHFLAFQPDLVQTFLFHANIVGRIAAWTGRGEPVVCGIRVAERHCRWHLWVDRIMSRWVDRYVCVSHSVAAFSSADGGLAAKKVTVIPNGVDLQRFPARSPAPLCDAGVPPGARVVTFVGRLEPQKGLAWLLDAAGEWLARVPDCHLIVAGQGPDRDSLQRLAIQRGVADLVHWLGWRSDIPEILAASDLLVLPSRWEGMPNVVLQAMASQRPVLATEVEGVRELLGESSDVQIVPYGDTASLTEKLVRILSDRDLASRLGRENRTRAERLFSMDAMVAAYADLWQSILANRS